MGKYDYHKKVFQMLIDRNNKYISYHLKQASGLKKENNKLEQAIKLLSKNNREGE